jgi:DNA transposition AAA+ family ATPase
VVNINQSRASTGSGGSLPIAAQDLNGMLAESYDDEATREILTWWYFTAKERNWNLARLAKVTGLSTSVLYRLFRGEYAAGAANSTTHLLRARDSFHSASENPDFIETSLSKQLFAVFDKTRALKTVSILWGKMGIGKSECIKEYARRNAQGRTVCVRFPAASTFSHFLAQITLALGVARNQTATAQREKIIQMLSAGQRLLIVDELHQAFLTARTNTAIKCCEFLREIAEVADCGLVLVGTELLEEQVFRGQHKEALRQLVDRGTMQIPLPAKATQGDYRKFLEFYGLDFPDTAKEPAAAMILADIIKSAGLRKLTLHLRDGAAYASRRSEAYEWKHFTAAFEAIRSLSK